MKEQIKKKYLYYIVKYLLYLLCYYETLVEKIKFYDKEEALTIKVTDNNVLCFIK